MPVAVSASSSNPAKPLERSYSSPVPRRKRTVKRRGRAKDEFESDEEIEREVRTDSDTDDDNSSIDSESDSESTTSDLHADAQSEVVTPSTTQSPPPVELARLPSGVAKDPSSSHAGIFADATNWAEMVAGEAENGAADLPVIDFADMGTSRLEPRAPSPARRSRKSHKGGKKSSVARSTSAPPPAAPPSVSQQGPAEGAHGEEAPVPSTSHEPRSDFPIRSRGQSARQAYQQRLETDPSFVPKVGEFWGHDDRLLDKGLRSLSGWWRGRWQTRGRGRGAFSMRGRGRGFAPGHPFSQEDGVAQDEPEVPPVERPWNHDGFEEMKRRDERRRAIQEQQQTSAASPRGFGFRGRGFVPARGRGGFGRGGSFSPTTPLPQRTVTSTVSMGDRVWYTQKPERMWTKQHDIFLYHDVATKPRPGVGPGVRVKLPGGKTPLIVRLPPRSGAAARTPDRPEEAHPLLAEEKVINVRIPSSGKAKSPEQPATVSDRTNELATTVEELSIEEVFTVRPNVVPNRRVDLSTSSSSTTRDDSPVAQSPLQPQALQAEVEEVQNPIEQLTTLLVSDGRASPSPQIQESILRNPPTSEATSSSVPVSTEEPQPRPAPPALHPLQTSFSPVPPPTSPPYGSPYGYAPAALPPGVAVNHQGMTYEYATGRPVYIQPTPPPMYTPRPMMHAPHPSLGMPFVPSHLHHHSAASPDFLAHPHTPHTPPIASFVDPATGLPIFSPARQSSRIEIRAPTDASDGKKSSRPSHQRSNLSTSVSFAAPEESQQPTYHLQPEALSEEAVQQDGMNQSSGHAHAPSMDSAMGYASYPQPYYYPEQYGYVPYMDMSQPPMHQYEAYQPEQHQHQQHHSSQPVVYY